MDCIFCKIAHREIATPLIYEDDDVVAFNDINPKAPIHFLIIPKKHLSCVDEITPQNSDFIAKIFEKILNGQTNRFKIFSEKTPPPSKKRPIY